MLRAASTLKIIQSNHAAGSFLVCLAAFAALVPVSAHGTDRFQFSTAYFPDRFVQSFSLERRFLEPRPKREIGVRPLQTPSGGRLPEAEATLGSAAEFEDLAPAVPRAPSPLGWKVATSLGAFGGGRADASGSSRTEFQSSLVLGLDWHWDERSDLTALVRMASVPLESYREGVVEFEWGSYRLWWSRSEDQAVEVPAVSEQNRKRRLPPGESDKDDPLAKEYLERLVLLQSQKLPRARLAERPARVAPGKTPGPGSGQEPTGSATPELSGDSLWVRAFLAFRNHELATGEAGRLFGISLGPKFLLEREGGASYRLAAIYTYFREDAAAFVSGLARSEPPAAAFELGTGVASLSGLARGLPTFEVSSDAAFAPSGPWSTEVGASLALLARRSTAIGFRAQLSRELSRSWRGGLSLQAALGGESTALLAALKFTVAL